MSLHVRRTDHWGSAVTDDDFRAFVAREADCGAAYLATDNRRTQERFVVRRVVHLFHL